MEIESPYVIMFEDGTPAKQVICHLYHPLSWSHREYGLLVADLIRHVANAFKVSEDDVFGWVEKEMRHPTTPIIRPS